MTIFRTLMFVPGNQEKRIEKARIVPADALILDLEDSVPATEKDAARKMVSTSIQKLASEGRDIFVRVNSLSTPYCATDIKAVVKKGLKGICLPKSESANDIHKAEALIAEAEKDFGIAEGSIGILALVETPMGIIYAYQIAAASQRIVGITFGAEDYALEMGVNRTKEGYEIEYPRMAIAVACHAAGVQAVDCVFTDVKDNEGLEAETKRIKQLGFQGKLVIHPDQVKPVNQIFTPSPGEIDHARKVVEAFENAVAQGSASVSLDGKMVDSPVAARAKKLIVLAELIAKKSEQIIK